MKTIVASGNRINSPSWETSWYFLADSALANAGKPFFIPDFADSFEAFLAPVVKISKLGKSIAGKYAPRYYSEMAPAIHFRASALRDKLISQGLSPDMAQSFDRSMIIGKFMPAEDFRNASPLRLVKNGETVAIWQESFFPESIDRIIEHVSYANTMKTGDLVAPGLSEATGIIPGDRLNIMLGEESVLLVAIK